MAGEYFQNLFGQMGQGGMGLKPVPQEPPIQVDGDEAPVHKGMFGIKGNFRDILGGLGDALLIGTGKDAIYTPTRQREKMGDAMRDFQDDPMVAIQRLGEAGFGKEAAALYDDYTRQQLAAEEARLKKLEFTQKTRNHTGAMIGSVLSPDFKPEDWPTTREIALKYALKRGEDFSGDLPETFDKNALRLFVDGGVPRDKQIDDEALAAFREERLDDYDEDREAIKLPNVRSQIKAREDTTKDRRRAQGERERRNRKTEEQGDKRIEISKTKGAGGRLPKPGAVTTLPNGVKVRIKNK